MVACLSIAIAASACRNESKDDASAGEDKDTAAMQPTAPLTGKEAPVPALPYIAVFDESSEQLEATKNPDYDPSMLSQETITQSLIANYPQVELEVDSTSGDTLFVHIADPSYLTQQMGSSGASMYLLEATYAFTELPDINVVHFDFEEGDHALPGAYSRERFTEKQPVR
jgi:hypothetical protein